MVQFMVATRQFRALAIVLTFLVCLHITRPNLETGPPVQGTEEVVLPCRPWLRQRVSDLTR